MSKVEKALKIYQKNKTLPNAELVQLFVKRLDMTPAGARTYAYNIRKKIANRPARSKKISKTTTAKTPKVAAEAA